MRVNVRNTLPSVTLDIKCAMSSITPTCESAPIRINTPIKKNNVRQSIFFLKEKPCLGNILYHKSPITPKNIHISAML